MGLPSSEDISQTEKNLKKIFEGEMLIQTQHTILVNFFYEFMIDAKVTFIRIKGRDLSKMGAGITLTQSCFQLPSNSLISMHENSF